MITRVQMQLREPYLLREKRTLRCGAASETIDELSRAHRHVEFFWFPYTEVAAVKILDEVDGPRRPRRCVICWWIRPLRTPPGGWLAGALSRLSPHA